MIGSPEPLPDRLSDALRASALRRGHFGERVLFFAQTGSTNDVAAALAERGAPEGTTVVALEQTAGRGRFGREWYSPAGAGLYVSVICRNARAAPLITLAGGVAAAEGIRQATGLPVHIKWPNDIVVAEITGDARSPGRRRKLAGILAEASTGAGGLQYVVLGFGINVRPAPYPPALAARASSIEAELGRTVDAGAVLSELLAALNRGVASLAAGDAAAVLARWRELAPSAIGARVEWTTDGVTRRGVTCGIDHQGALLVRMANRIERIVSGEVMWL